MSFFDRQVALVTGAGSGIGRAIAVELAAQGATVCLLGRRLALLQETIEQIEKLEIYDCAIPYCIDVTVESALEDLLNFVRQTFGRIDILVHSAGICSLGTMNNSLIQNLDRHYQTNLRAPYLLTQLLLPQLKASYGQVVFINSTVTCLPARASLGQYTAMKTALKVIADSLRAEVNSDGIRIISIYPGRTNSPMQASIHQQEGKSYFPEKLMQPADVALAVIHALSLPNTAEVTDITIRPSVAG